MRKEKLLLLGLAPFAGLATAQAQLAPLPTTWLDADGFDVELTSGCVAAAVQVGLGDITVDGDLSDWADVKAKGRTYSFPYMTLTGTWGQPPTAGLPAESNSSGLWYAAWDSQFLYLAVEVTDDVLQNEDSIGNSDGIEIFLDGDFSHIAGLAWNQPGQDYVNDWQKQITFEGDTANGLYDVTALESFDLDMSVETATTASGYNIEIRIRISSINSSLLTASVGSYLGFDMKIADTDEVNAARETVIGWCSNLNDNYANPALFGVLALGNEDGNLGDGPVEFTTFWPDVAIEGGYKNTGTGWVNDAYWPWVYSYGTGGTWFYVLNTAGVSADAFYAYDITNGWFFANESWSFYYSFDNGEWVRFAGTGE